MENIVNDLRRFVVDNYLFGQEGGFSNADSFLEKGIIDSTGMMELVAHVEKTYRIKVENKELVPANLDSIERVASFVKKKQG